jgi:hypothetical protein
VGENGGRAAGPGEEDGKKDRDQRQTVFPAQRRDLLFV